MKRLLILGAGTAGTMVANKMRRDLSHREWNITIVEREKVHFYQPGFLFIPFGYAARKNISKPLQKFIPSGVDIIYQEIESIEAAANRVILINGSVLDYDIMIF